MTKFLSNRHVLTAARIILGGIFIYAGSISIQSPEQFAESTAGYQMLPTRLVNLFALALPPFEMLVGALLIFGWPKRIAIFSALVLTIVFIIALSTALARGLTIDCGCFGHGKPSRAGMWISLGRDVVMGFFLALLYRREWKPAEGANPAP